MKDAEEVLQDSLLTAGPAWAETADSLADDTLSGVPLAEAGVIPEAFRVDTAIVYKEEYFLPGDTVKGYAFAEATGKEAEPLPYLLSSDDILTTCMFLCFFLLAYVLFNGKRYLSQRLMDFSHVRERSSLFAVETGSDVRYRLSLVLQTSLFLGIFFFDYSHDSFPELFLHYSSVLLLGCYAGIVLLWYVLKLLLYAWVDWVFFDKQKHILWIDSYTLLYSLLGILLFPLLLLVLYFDLPNVDSWLLFAIIGVLVEILLLYKCFNIFFSKMYGFLYFIVYLCALEMVPCFLLWQALITANNLLIIKY